MTAIRKLVLWIFVLAVSLSVVSTPTARAFSADGSNSKVKTRIVPFVEQVMAKEETPGLAIGAVHSGEIVFVRGLGFKNLDTVTPVTNAALDPIPG